jgi:hypothetical protein
MRVSPEDKWLRICLRNCVHLMQTRCRLHTYPRQQTAPLWHIDIENGDAGGGERARQRASAAALIIVRADRPIRKGRSCAPPLQFAENLNFISSITLLHTRLSNCIKVNRAAFLIPLPLFFSHSRVHTDRRV